MRESEPEKRRKPLIYIRLTNVQEHLYPHKGAFFRGSFLLPVRRKRRKTDCISSFYRISNIFRALATGSRCSSTQLS